MGLEIFSGRDKKNARVTGLYGKTWCYTLLITRCFLCTCQISHLATQLSYPTSPESISTHVARIITKQKRLLTHNVLQYTNIPIVNATPGWRRAHHAAPASIRRSTATAYSTHPYHTYHPSSSPPGDCH